MKSLHTSLNNDHSGCKPSTSMSLSKYLHILSKSSFFYPYISPLPPPPFCRPILNIHTSMLQMPKPPQSAMLTTSATLPTPRRLYKSTLHFLSFRDTLRIHLIIIQSVLSRLCRFAFFIAQVSVPYVNAIWTPMFIYMMHHGPSG